MRIGGRQGLQSQGGGVGSTAYIACSFDGANTSLLLTTVTVVAVLLMITYRSPWLWLLDAAIVRT